MDKISRRDFLKLVGAGSGVVAAASLPVTGVMSLFKTKETLSFRGVAGLPSASFPAYATSVVQGSVNLLSGTGIVMKGLYAGSPIEDSNLALPGTSRAIRVTSVSRDGQGCEIRGVVDDRASLLPGESPEITMRIDQAAGAAEAVFFGTPVTMRLAT